MKISKTVNNLKRSAQLLICVAGMISVSAQASYWERPVVQQFAQDMVNKHQFDKSDLQDWFSFSKKRQVIIDAMMRPAEGKPWNQYRPIFLTDKRISKGVEFWKQNKTLLERAEKEFGVPAEIIVAIIGVETFYGNRSGRFPVIDALATLGFDYPPRSEFFLRELEHFLLLARDEKLAMKDTLGSYAGAMGMGQFISSSYRNYAVDFDKDGTRNLWQVTDAIGSVANYFKRHGWRLNEPVAVRADHKGRNFDATGRMMEPDQPLSSFRKAGLVFEKNIKTKDDMGVLVKLETKQDYEYWIGLHNFYVITRYNHSPLYAMAVYQLSQEIKGQMR